MRLVGNIAVFILLALVSCSPIKYKTFFDVSKDPTYDFKPGRTIGLAPIFWTAQGQSSKTDELKEKQLLLYMKTELENRGFSAGYLEPDKLEERDNKIILKPAKTYPDWILTCEFGIQPDTVKVPGEAFGHRDATGGGYYSKTSSYEVQTYDLSIACYLWSGGPEYKQKIWYARITQGSPAPDLSDRAPALIAQLFKEKFPR